MLSSTLFVLALYSFVGTVFFASLGVDRPTTSVVNLPGGKTESERAKNTVASALLTVHARFGSSRLC